MSTRKGCSRRYLMGAGVGLALMGLLAPYATAQTFLSGSTGADGPFAPTSHTTLPLPPSGILNFTTITIPAGVTVTITRNAANTPATLLATGEVTIAGTIDVSGQPGGEGLNSGVPTFLTGGAGGPGGGDGGSGGTNMLSIAGGAGLGPGGGQGGIAGGGQASCGGGGAGHNGAGSAAPSTSCSTTPGAGGSTYGTAQLLPLLGGSGGGGGSTPSFNSAGAGGGGGGGALLIASSTRITLTGTLRANGGAGGRGAGFFAGSTGGGGGGSGGAIRLVAPILTGTGGRLEVNGGSGGSKAFGASGDSSGGAGASGRIRLEAFTFTATYSMTAIPSQSSPQGVTLTNTPTLRITTIGGLPVPASPTGSYGSPDVILPASATSPISVDLAGTNIPPGTPVTLTARPATGPPTTATGTLSGTTASTTASLSLPLAIIQPNVLLATATFPLLASAGTGPLYVEGEEVTHIKVAALIGGHTQVSYLTRSGREIAQ